MDTTVSTSKRAAVAERRSQSSRLFESPAATPKHATSGLSCRSGLDIAESKPQARQNREALALAVDNACARGVQAPAATVGLRRLSLETRWHLLTLHTSAESRTRGHCGPKVRQRCLQLLELHFCHANICQPFSSLLEILCGARVAPASCAKAELHRPPWPAAFMAAAPDMYCNPPTEKRPCFRPFT